ncbi:MAG: very short patch repair endonuclease [Dehalococcoidia bacterium]
MDRVSTERRSENMRRIKSKNTTPELVVRQLLHRLGYRYRIHCRNLPGNPDIVFTKKKKAIFVHGCDLPPFYVPAGMIGLSSFPALGGWGGAVAANSFGVRYPKLL